jgi:hypothetical protein
MATDIVGSLFGVTPELYQEQRDQMARQRAMQLAQLDPLQQASYGAARAGQQLGGAFASAMGVEDPQLRLISLRNSLAKQFDLTTVDGLTRYGAALQQAGDTQGAVGVASELRKIRAEESKQSLQEAQAIKALTPPKLTGDERYIADLRLVESMVRAGKEPSKEQLSNANIAAQMLSKPRSFFDQASGQTVTIPATDPSKAFPLTFELEEFQSLGAKKGTTTEQVTGGNLPTASQTSIAEIDANLTKLDNSKPELQGFLNALNSGQVKYNATSNTLDLLGATVLPAFGLKEKGDQVKKDEIQRALVERVNTLLIQAKGTQTEGDATRARDQIASSTTYLSQARMIGAIESLMRVEEKLAKELEAKKTALQAQGKTVAPNVPARQAQPQAQPQQPAQPPAQARPQPTAQQPQTQYTDDQKIQIFMRANPKASREQAIAALKRAGKI